MDLAFTDLLWQQGGLECGEAVRPRRASSGLKGLKLGLGRLI